MCARSATTAPACHKNRVPQVREANLGLRAKHEPAKLRRSKIVILSEAESLP